MAYNVHLTCDPERAAFVSKDSRRVPFAEARRRTDPNCTAKPCNGTSATTTAASTGASGGEESALALAGVGTAR